MKQNNIPFKERMRNYDYQFNQPYKQEELAIKKENKAFKKLKEQPHLKGGAE